MTETTSADSASSEKHFIQCGELMDIASAAQLKSSLLQGLESGLPMALDVANVERADTAALQVLTAFVSDASAQGVAVEWLEPSDGLCESARLLGLLEALQLGNKVA